jgi:hypothetical protein
MGPAIWEMSVNCSAPDEVHRNQIGALELREQE